MASPDMESSLAIWMAAVVLCLLAQSFGAIVEVVPPNDGSVESVSVLPNGSVVVQSSYEAVDVSEAASQALSEGQLKDLLHWAISHSDPKTLEEQAAGKTSSDDLERRRQVHQAIEAMRNQPSEAQLIIEAIEIVDNDTMPEAAKLGALEALQYLLEPIDNANDLDKLGGVEVLVTALEPNNSDAVRAGAAHALAVAASNNAQFQLRLLDAGGQGLVIQLLEVAELDDPDQAAMGLYAISNLQENEGFREAFCMRGGLGVLQHALSSTKAAAGKLRRRALTLIGDLAPKVKDFGRYLHLLPAKGQQELTEAVEHSITRHDWDMTERGLHAVQSIAAHSEGAQLLQSSGTPGRLEALKEAVLEEMESAQHTSKEYLRELLQLIEQTQEKLAEHFAALEERGAKPVADEL